MMPVSLPHQVTREKDFENPRAHPKRSFWFLSVSFIFTPHPVFGSLIREPSVTPTALSFPEGPAGSRPPGQKMRVREAWGQTAPELQGSEVARARQNSETEAGAFVVHVNNFHRTIKHPGCQAAVQAHHINEPSPGHCHVRLSIQGEAR